jgi:hypothetical protein
MPGRGLQEKAHRNRPRIARVTMTHNPCLFPPSGTTKNVTAKISSIGMLVVVLQLTSRPSVWLVTRGARTTFPPRTADNHSQFPSNLVLSTLIQGLQLLVRLKRSCRCGQRQRCPRAHSQPSTFSFLSVRRPHHPGTLDSNLTLFY